MNKLDELIALLCPNGVKYQELAHAVSIERGKRVVREQLDETGLYPVYQNSLTPLGYHSQWNYPAETTFLIVAGAAGEIGYSTCNFWAADDCFPWFVVKIYQVATYIMSCFGCNLPSCRVFAKQASRVYPEILLKDLLSPSSP